MFKETQKPKQQWAAVWIDITRDYLEMRTALEPAEQQKLIQALQDAGIQSCHLEAHGSFSLDGHLIVIGKVLDAKQIWLYDPAQKQIRKMAD